MTDDDSRKLVLFPALNALLQPTAETLGAELNERITDWLEERRRKRRAKNVEHHLQMVQRRIGETDEILEPPDEGQLDFFAEWVEGV